MVDPSTVFVVSGGAKGITARCVIELAKHYRCKFILMGRSAQAESEPGWAQNVAEEPELKKRAMADVQARGEKPTPALVNRMVNGVLSQREITDTLREIEAAGGKAIYVSADITDQAAVQSAIAAAGGFGTITGIIHGAGNLADKLIEQKTEADFEYVYAAKVHGLENLLAAVQPNSLRYLVLFSSVAGFFGNVGQADYAIANEILNKTAHRFKALHPDCRVISINWGPWEGGMVTPQLREYFDSLNIQVIPVNVGTRMLIDELEAPNNSVQVIIGSAITVPPVTPNGSLETYQLHRKINLAGNPFLGDHVVNGQAVLPMVAAMSWMSSACEQLYPGYRYFGFRDYRVLKGIVFDETLADDYVLNLKELSKGEDEITLEALVQSQQNGKPRFHYKTRIILVRQLPPMPTYQPLPDAEATTTPIAGTTLYTNGTLFHGYSFQGVDEVVSIGPKGLKMRCHVPVVDDEYQGQFPVQAFNYFMADIGLQSIGIWAKQFYDAGSLPLRAMHGDHYGNVPFGGAFYVSMQVRSHSDTNVAADIHLHDEQNLLYMSVMDIEVTMSKRLNQLFLKNRLPEQ